VKDNNTAKVYAKTLDLLGQEKGVDFAKELTTLTEVINTSNDLENVMFLDVFTVEEKIAVFNDIASKVSLNPLVASSVKYLITEKRISLLPLIFKEIVVMDDDKKGFLRGTIEGSSSQISDEEVAKLKKAITSKVGNKELKLDYKENKNITTGYKITVADYQLDATVDNQLQNLKQTILN